MTDKIIRDDKRLPDSSASPKYVYNKVKQTASGHRFEIDDSPGNERIFEGHKSGTYREISSDGKIVDVSVANRHEYTKSTKTVTIDGFSDFMCQGSKIVIKGGSLIEVMGQYDLTVAGDVNLIISGDIKATCDNATISSKDTINFRAKNINFQAEETISAKGKTINIESSDDTNIKAGQSFVTDSQKTQMSSSGEFNIKGYSVSLAGRTYIGQSDLGSKEGSNVVTLSGPSQSSYAKI